MAKEPCSYGKRALFIWQKSPAHTAKETYMRAHTLSVSERGTTPALALRSIHISSVRAEICIHGKRTYNTYHVILSHNTSSYHISHHPITYHIILSHRAEICIHGQRVYVDHQLQFLLSEYMSLRVYECKGICRTFEYKSICRPSIAVLALLSI